MSSSTPTRRWRSPLRHRLTILASAAALSIVGLLAVTVPAHADDNIQITDSADPVAVNTSYNYIVTIPDPTFQGGFAFAAVDLSGAAATFTGAITSNNGTLSCSASGTHAQCDTTGDPGTAPITITATVLPTAAGTVTADAVLEGMGPIASDSTTTTVGNGNGCTITGTAGDDTLTGTNGNDVICGLGGNDILNGGNGDDTIDGGNGDDTLIDTAGTDTLQGSNGADTINVQDGLGGDTADGGRGADTCTVDPGDTTISC